MKNKVMMAFFALMAFNVKAQLVRSTLTATDSLRLQGVWYKDLVSDWYMVGNTAYVNRSGTVTEYVLGGSVPTWQQTLIAGSQITQNNAVDFNQTELLWDSLKSFILLNPIGDIGYNKILMSNAYSMEFEARNNSSGTGALRQYISMYNADSAMGIGVMGGENNEYVQMRIDRNGFDFTEYRIRNTDERPNFAVNGHQNQASAEFEINSDNRGALLPRLTQSQRNAIAAPATSLIIYQTDNTPGYYYYDGSAWVRLNTGSGTVTSVGLSMPSGLTVTGSPITTNGTLAVTTTLNGYVKGDGSGLTATATIPATDLTGTIDNARLSNNVGYVISHAIGGGVSTAASTTEYMINGPTGASGTEGVRQVPIAIAGTIRQLYVYTSTAQPATGSYVLTIRKNSTSTATTITLAASAAAGVYSTTTTTTVAAGDLISLQCVNNATGASATLRAFSIFISTN